MNAIPMQKSLPSFAFLEAIRHIRHCFSHNVFKKNLISLNNHTYGTRKSAGF